ncbi:hypothetical protein [Flavisolibacter ginsenosidimutans]|uniref:Uncharacterized protein n=1 Tax=Flavisolibacter ginsenosidimutans TaxID=661481 RepID=A0A5B8UK32_9BACT|nr:hypothetical protein [Flavisolibacter ginsenosidimutans]QEC57034.1 hypothetical protein FSB75_14365 [Flavisolibacter ginsenosidimutans]
MKQLSIRLIAPFFSLYSVALRLVYFTSRSANRAITTPQRLVGKWRLYLNYCPECNSCAPKLHHCDVCKADTKSYFAWNKEVEKTWWKRYAEKHHIAA